MEGRKDLKIENKKSNLSLENRKRLAITGVIEVLSFNEERISLNTVLGMLSIKGSELKMSKLDVQNGDVSIAGKIDSMIYSGVKAKKEKYSFFKKLFR